MLEKVYKFWNKYGFEIVIVVCLTFIISFGIYRKIKGYSGTWSRGYPVVFTQKSFDQGTPMYDRSVTDRTSISDSKGEVECRRVLQTIFNRPFNKDRPDFLRNPVTGGNFNLELDCYDPELKIAVEYNGIQHYKYIPYFHKNKEAFLNQKYRDDMKRRICKEYGIKLIEVPYTVKVCDIRNFLISSLKNNNLV
jgi:hypothetical protein